MLFRSLSLVNSIDSQRRLLFGRFFEVVVLSSILASGCTTTRSLGSATSPIAVQEIRDAVDYSAEVQFTRTTNRRAAGTSAGPLSPGSRSEHVVERGTIVGVFGPNLDLEVKQFKSIEIPLSRIQQIQVVDHAKGARYGLGGGLLFGAVLGAVSGVVSAGSCNDRNYYGASQCPSTAEVALVKGFWAALLGAGLGTILGAAAGYRTTLDFQ